MHCSHGDVGCHYGSRHNPKARNGDEMETLTRNCKLAEGQRALGQRKRQIDTVSPEVRAQFKAMQAPKQPMH